MRKYFVPAGEEDHWDALWEATPLEERLRHAREDFLAPVFARYLPRRGKILEAGCGVGHYVLVYGAQGYDIEGVEESAVAVGKARERYPELPVYQADVRALPYPSGSLAAYFSGGVLEHFEEGPAAALREAHRVLQDDGVLLLTVPYLNLLRRLRDAVLAGRRLYRIVSGFTHESAPDGLVFYQYAFTRREAVSVLEQAGFVAVATRGVQIVWGARKLLGWGSPCGGVGGGRGCDSGGSMRWPRLRRLLLIEHSDNPVVEGALRLLGEVCGHMLLVVCRKGAA